MDFTDRCENVSWSSIACDTRLDRDGRDVLVVVAKVAYEVSAQGVARATLVPVRRREAADGGGGVLGPDDLACDEKPGTDVALVGTAQPPPRSSGHRSAYAWLSMGALRKVVSVFGPRVYAKSWRGVAPSNPSPLVEPVPLRFDHAFGGTDPATQERETHNPIGRGFASDPATLVGKLAPQLEPAEEGGAKVHPSHGAFAPIPADWEPRRALAGTHDEPWARSRAPVRPKDFDVRHHSWAVPGLWSATPLFGDEPVEVGGVLASGPWRFRLPRYAVEMESVLDGETRKHPTHLDAVLVDADALRVELTWRAAIRLPRKWERVEKVSVLGVGTLPDDVLGIRRRAPSPEALVSPARSS